MPRITSFPPDRFAARTWRVADGATKQCSQCGPTHKPQRRQRTSPRALRVNCTGGFSAGAAVELAESLKQQTNRVAQAAAGEGENDANETTVRSEEHTSELQSLMRISYAVFCLKKKIKKDNNIVNDY